ncbi:MAG: fliE [Modestobacter sp.]|jgi:flagellar hook-basal body complex protein FliE|nr:fliE [Modestobacter sp.]
MTSAIGAISGFAVPSFSGITDAPSVTSAAAASSTSPVSGEGSFASVLAGTVDQLNGVQANADALATQASTGTLQDAHDYMIASTEATLATDTVVTLKNQAVSAFTEIMRMPV